MKFIFSLCVLFTFGANNNTLNAQKYYDIQLASISENIETQACYDVQLRSAEATEMNLGGQNYRLYYDANILSLEEEESRSLLSTEDYTTMMLKDNIQGADASGVGDLPYESTLGFLNFGIDLNNVTTGGVNLPSDGEWINTARICFDVLEEADLSDPILHWAREELTSEYATAFVEVAQWVEPNVTTPAIGNDYFDAILTSIETKELEDSKINIYPNPTIDRITIEMDFPKSFEVEIWNTAGILVINKRIDGLKGDFTLELEDLPAGTYSVLINAGSERYFRLIEKINP